VRAKLAPTVRAWLMVTVQVGPVAFGQAVPLQDEKVDCESGWAVRVTGWPAWMLALHGVMPLATTPQLIPPRELVIVPPEPAAACTPAVSV
jgi:hypothetical protein